jgi:predicted RecA/RadA family phage recombinase
MGQITEGNVKSLVNGATAIGRGLRVKLSSGVLVLAGLTDRELGVMFNRCEANDHAGVLLRTAAGTCPMVAADSFAVGATLYTAASGKVSDTQGTGAFAIGTALEAASGDGSIVEVLRSVGDETAGS